jgi:hypothetical protein
MKLNEIKQNIYAVLERIGLEGEVSLEEIEKEILAADTVFQSLLVLGILRRILYQEDDEAMEIFLPAVTEWKNCLPHKELGGLSPIELRKKYPPGPYEARFISELIGSYKKWLEINPIDEPFDMEDDFDSFQREFFNRKPFEQPFSRADGNSMTVKEIIMEERRRSGWPEKDIGKIGIKIFSENLAEEVGRKMEEIEDKYADLIEELERIRQNHRLWNKARIKEIRKQFEEEEPYHRCGPFSYQFYSNYAVVVLLDGGSKGLVISLLDHSLALKPDYEPALQMKKDLEDYWGEN